MSKRYRVVVEQKVQMVMNSMHEVIDVSSEDEAINEALKSHHELLDEKGFDGVGYPEIESVEEQKA